MKNFTFRFIFSICAFAFLSALQAQNMPNGVMPAIGDIIQTVTAESDNIFEGDSGNGVTWDFSVIAPMPLTEPTTNTYVNPDDTPFAAEFPTANMALSSVTSNGTFYSYYIKEGSTLQYIGGESTGSFIYFDQNPQLVLDANLSGGAMATDDYAGFSDFGMTTLFTTGVQTFNIDASGTLIMPSGVFDNAVRVVNVNERIDSSGNEMSTSLIRLTSTVYSWYIPQQIEPVMTIVYAEGESEFIFSGNDPVITPIPLSKSVIYNPDPAIVNSTRPNLNGIEGLGIEKIFPNPTSTSVQIEIAIERSQQVNLFLTNSVGQVVSSTELELAAGTIQHQLNMNDLPAGNYTVSILSNDNILSKRITKIN